MSSWKREILILALLCGSLGCSICANPFDNDYVGYGSRTPRHDMRHGRVGSPLSDPAHREGASELVEAIDSDYEHILQGVPGDVIDEPIMMDISSNIQDVP